MNKIIYDYKIKPCEQPYKNYISDYFLNELKPLSLKDIFEYNYICFTECFPSGLLESLKKVFVDESEEILNKFKRCMNIWLNIGKYKITNSQCLEILNLIDKIKNNEEFLSLNNYEYNFLYCIPPILEVLCNSDYIILLPYNYMSLTDAVCYMADATRYSILPFQQKLLQVFHRKIKQFNMSDHNSTYHQSILKQIINTDYEKLKDIDKNQVIDIINEYYDIEIDCFDFITHKTIQREFI